MRIGYSFWGFLGPGITDTPDGGRSHRRTLIDGLIGTGHEVVFLQANRDLAEAGHDLTECYAWDGGLPRIDALFLEWRWPILGRNTTECGTSGHLPPGCPAGLACADFSCLPLADASCDLAVAAFCLYHAAGPGKVVGEITRCLRQGGTAILVTKSADSYRELDHLMADSGLDPCALARPSLYQAAHSGNLPDLAAEHLTVQRVIHETHRFAFNDLTHTAEYLATSPKYGLPARLAAEPEALAAALRERVDDQPVTTSSIVTYVVATRPEKGET